MRLLPGGVMCAGGLLDGRAASAPTSGLIG